MKEKRKKEQKRTEKQEAERSKEDELRGKRLEVYRCASVSVSSFALEGLLLLLSLFLAFVLHFALKRSR